MVLTLREWWVVGVQLKRDADLDTMVKEYRSAQSPTRGPRRTSWGADDFKDHEGQGVSMRHILDRLDSEDEALPELQSRSPVPSHLTHVRSHHASLSVATGKLPLGLMDDDSDTSDSDSE